MNVIVTEKGPCILCDCVCEHKETTKYMLYYQCTNCGHYNVPIDDLSYFKENLNFQQSRFKLAGFSFFNTFNKNSPIVISSNNWIKLINEHKFPNKLKERKKLFLKYLYKITGGIPGKKIEGPPFTTTFSKDLEEHFAIVDNLNEEGFIQFEKSSADNGPTIYGSPQLTIFAIEQIEQESDDHKIEISVLQKGENFMHNEHKITTKIFISHSSKDRDVVKEIIFLLNQIGVPKDRQSIFCSSFEGYAVPLGKDFLDHIKNEFDENILVLFILSEDFFSSAICLCEMGAAWVKAKDHIPILIPPFDYTDIQGAIKTTINGFKINEKQKLNSFKNTIQEILPRQ